MRTQQDSTICLKCATKQRLMVMPCAEHYPAMPSELCQHNRQKLVFIHNGTAIACHDCDLFIPTTAGVE